MMILGASNPVASIAAVRAEHPLRAGNALPVGAFEAIRRRMMLDFCKWDPQVGDVVTLASFPLLIERARWNEMCDLAESLAAETIEAEQQLIGRGNLHRVLGIPKKLRAEFQRHRFEGVTPAAARVMRFDFHWTRDGWRVSEVNSDVPGGFAEASEFPLLVSEWCEGAVPAGNPAAAWADAMWAIAPPGTNVALLAASGFMEDQQVVAYLARILTLRGIRAHIARPQQIQWLDGLALLEGKSHRSALAAIVRFYQAEWMTSLKNSDRHPYFTGGRTPVVNPGSAILSESKRLPLVWPKLRGPMPTWRRLLPESRDPRDAPWRKDDGWLLKTAFCNTGDTVVARAWTTPRQWRAACRDVWLRPGRWVAQRRFNTLPIATPRGQMYPCIGVYTVNGRAAGAYARLSLGPIVNFQAIDAALLVEENEGG